MEVYDDGWRRCDKKRLILPFWQSFWENLQIQKNDVVTFTGRSSSAAISPILRLDTSDNLYFPYEPVKQERRADEIEDSEKYEPVKQQRRADEIEDSEKPRNSYKPIPGELDLWWDLPPLGLLSMQLSEYLCDLFACRRVEPDNPEDIDMTLSEMIIYGNYMVQKMKSYHNIRPHLIAYIEEESNLFRQLKEIVVIYKLAMSGRDLDALKEITRLSFLSVDPSSADSAAIHLQNIPLDVKACLPGLLNYALNCLDDVANIDVSLGPVKAKIAFSLYCNLNQNWARDLCEKMARSL